MLAWLGEWSGRWWPAAAAVAFLVLTVLEARHPRAPSTAVALRWSTNLGLCALAVLLATLAAPWRLGSDLDAWSRSPLDQLGDLAGDGAVLAVGAVLLDFLAYWLHRMQHLPLLWRFHLVHHADRELDASTALRHHPGEFLVNAVAGTVAMGLVGVPPWIVPVYALAALLADLGQHANLALPPRLDRALSWILVTPRLHQVHHSEAPEHFDVNFGAVFSLWDHLFGTWHPAPTETLRFGVAGIGAQGPTGALFAPFRPRG